jgi:hypothetical protein
MKVKAKYYVFSTFELDFELNSIVRTVPGEIAAPGKDLVN